MKLLPLLLAFLQIGAAAYLLVLAGTHLRKLWQEYRARKVQQ